MANKVVEFSVLKWVRLFRATLPCLSVTITCVDVVTGSIYAFSSRIFRINGVPLPYAWNHSITYDPEYGKMPYLQEILSVEYPEVVYDPTTGDLQYELTASIAKGVPSNQCPRGFLLDTEGPYCQGESSVCSQHPSDISLMFLFQNNLWGFSSFVMDFVMTYIWVMFWNFKLSHNRFQRNYWLLLSGPQTSW